MNKRKPTRNAGFNHADPAASQPGVDAKNNHAGLLLVKLGHDLVGGGPVGVDVLDIVQIWGRAVVPTLTIEDPDEGTLVVSHFSLLQVEFFEADFSFKDFLYADVAVQSWWEGKQFYSSFNPKYEYN